jgi:hypothetical protein
LPHGAASRCRARRNWRRRRSPEEPSHADDQRLLRHPDPDFWRDHAPPHFHALYAEHEALIDIRTLEVIEGSLPKRALALVLEWASEHRAELMEDWDLCNRMQTPKKIAPLS